MLIFFCFNQCKKPKPYQVTLPDITSTKQNTFGFMYSGKVWSSVQHGIFFTPSSTPFPDCTVDSDTGTTKTFIVNELMKIKNNGVITDYSSCTFFLHNIPYVNMANNSLIFDTLRNSNKIIFKDYTNYSNNTFHVTITLLDTTNKIISGVFSGNVYKPISIFPNHLYIDTHNSIQISSGRFDIKYFIHS